MEEVAEATANGSADGAGRSIGITRKRIVPRPGTPAELRGVEGRAVSKRRLEQEEKVPTPLKRRRSLPPERAQNDEHQLQHEEEAQDDPPVWLQRVLSPRSGKRRTIAVDHDGASSFKPPVSGVGASMQLPPFMLEEQSAAAPAPSRQYTPKPDWMARYLAPTPALPSFQPPAKPADPSLRSPSLSPISSLPLPPFDDEQLHEAPPSPRYEDYSAAQPFSLASFTPQPTPAQPIPFSTNGRAARQHAPQPYFQDEPGEPVYEMQMKRPSLAITVPASGGLDEHAPAAIRRADLSGPEAPSYYHAPRIDSRNLAFEHSQSYLPPASFAFVGHYTPPPQQTTYPLTQPYVSASVHNHALQHPSSYGIFPPFSSSSPNSRQENLAPASQALFQPVVSPVDEETRTFWQHRPLPHLEQQSQSFAAQAAKDRYARRLEHEAASQVAPSARHSPPPFPLPASQPALEHLLAIPRSTTSASLRFPSRSPVLPSLRTPSPAPAGADADPYGRSPPLPPELQHTPHRAEADETEQAKPSGPPRVQSVRVEKLRRESASRTGRGRERQGTPSPRASPEDAVGGRAGEREVRGEGDDETVAIASDKGVEGVTFDWDVGAEGEKLLEAVRSEQEAEAEVADARAVEEEAEGGFAFYEDPTNPVEE
ncbi:hypothetical protein JCM10207_001942 [Rhodosporidiobolus poonsookiae]